jgi:hypothetical protein
MGEGMGSIPSLDNIQRVTMGFDPQRARELLAQAGYADASTFPAVKFIVPS